MNQKLNGSSDSDKLVVNPKKSFSDLITLANGKSNESRSEIEDFTGVQKSYRKHTLHLVYALLHNKIQNTYPKLTGIIAFGKKVTMKFDAAVRNDKENAA